MSALETLDGYHQAYQRQPDLTGLLTSVTEQLQARMAETGELQDISDGLIGFSRNLYRLDSYYRKSFSVPLPISELLNVFPSLWEGIESRLDGHSGGNGRVRLQSIHQMQGLEAPFVFIPFLVSEEFPLTREVPELLSAAEQALLGVDLAYRIDEEEEARLLAVGMSRASRKIVLSCHQSDASHPVLPSAFYQQLREARSELLGVPLESDHRTQDEQTGVESETDDAFTRYTGSSLWANLDKQAAEPLFEAEETAYLSASSIKTYMACPRQFYYKHLLRLPQPGSEAATLGSLVHRLMEVFNRQADQLPYTAETLRRLAETLFEFDTQPEIFAVAGFQEDDRRVLKRMSHLALANLKQRLLEAVADLERKEYFTRYGNLKAVEAEQALDSFTLEGIERCRFSGILDAMIQLEDGSWEIVDYKTFRSAYGTGLDTCDKHFRGTLDPLPDDEALDHDARFGAKLSVAYPKDYQLPLYYLACRQNPRYGEQLRAAALQIIRPPFPDNPNQGSIRLALAGQDIEACQEQMLSDINRFIVEPILGSEIFEVNGSGSACGNCGYFGICDIGAEEEV
jgi:ATP-dependent exoDNAse (exonuclease V) beta subunit